jgi:hypothetical protein
VPEAADNQLSEQDAPPSKLLIEAIARRLCVDATYNRTAVRLAPHIAYTRHGDLFVDAVTVERDGKKPKEIKLGTFKLAGLVDLRLTRRLFVPLADFKSDDEKYAGATVFVVDR